MNLAEVLLPLAAGWIFLKLTHLFRFRFSRQTSYHIWFASAVCGFVLYGLSFGIMACLGIPDWEHIKTWAEGSPDLVPPESQVSLIMACCSPAVVVNRIWGSAKEADNASRKHGDYIELKLSEAANMGRLVEITIRSRKSYIGKPISYGNENTPDADVVLIPYFSGYRDESTLELKPEREYTPVLEEVSKPGSSGLGWSKEDYQIVFPMPEIVSVRHFNAGAFEEFGLPRPGKRRPPRDDEGPFLPGQTVYARTTKERYMERRHLP